MDGNNWYVYCRNNPIIFVDPDGTDAILVNKKVDNAAGKAGLEHSAVFIQDKEGNWHYFSWQEEVVYVAVDDPSIFDSLDTMNQWLVEHGEDTRFSGENPYTSSVYIEGNFKESITEAERLKNEFDTLSKGEEYYGTTVFGQEIANGAYNLLTNNCGQVSMDLLGRGIMPDNTTKVGDYINSQRAPKDDKLLSKIGSAAFSLVADTVPNVSIRNLQSIFNNKSTNLAGYKASQGTMNTSGG